MSRRWVIGLLALAAMAIAPRAVAAQAAQWTRAELEAHRDSLQPLLEQARSVVAQREERREEARAAAVALATRVDTLQVGLVRIITPPAQVETARALFSEVWSDFPAIDRSPVLEATWFTFQWPDADVRIFVDQNDKRIVARADLSRDLVKNQIRAAVASTIALDPGARDARLVRWLNESPFGALEQVRMEAIYRQIVTAPSYAARACIDGDLDACITSFNLTDPASTVRDWYTPEERRDLVRHGSTNLPRSMAEERAACVDDADYGSCDTALETYYRLSRDLSPFGQDARASLLAVALELGGPGSWSRSFEVPGESAASALARVSGRTPEQLVAEWRARILGADIAPYQGLAAQTGLTFMWMLVFASLAMRSKRWRLG